MTKQEFYQTINERELGLGEILKTSAGIFFENLQTWLLLSLIVFLPTGIVLQYLMLQIPVEEIVKAYMSADLEQLRQVNWNPVWIFFGATLAFNLINVIASLAASTYTDHWLHDDLPSFGGLFRETIRKWPRGILIVIWQMLMCLGIVVMAVLSVGFFLLPGMLLVLAISILYQYAVVATAVHGHKGFSAYGYAFEICRRRIGKSLTLVLIMMVINALFSSVLTSITSSFIVLENRTLLYCVVLGLINVIANLTTFLLSIGATLHLLNLEYLSGPHPTDTHAAPEVREIPNTIDIS